MATRPGFQVAIFLKTDWTRVHLITMYLGCGANGVVELVRAGDVEYALKYWIPWRAKITLKHVPFPENVSNFIAAVNSQPHMRGSASNGIRISSYGATFPVQKITAMLNEHGMEEEGMQISRDHKSPGCLWYTIEHGIPMEVQADCSIKMPMAGPTVFAELPLTKLDILSLISVMTAAASSALKQRVALADLKPCNICRWHAKRHPRWIVIDIDNLPMLDECARDHATYNVFEAKSAARASLASLLITTLLACGNNPVEIDYLFSHESQPIAPLVTLENKVKSAPSFCAKLLKPLVERLKMFTVHGAIEDLDQIAVKALAVYENEISKG